MNVVVELNNEDAKRKIFQVFKNISFDPGAIAAFAYFAMIQNTRLSLPF